MDSELRADSQAKATRLLDDVPTGWEEVNVWEARHVVAGRWARGRREADEREMIGQAERMMSWLEGQRTAGSGCVTGAPCYLVRPWASQVPRPWRATDNLQR